MKRTLILLMALALGLAAPAGADRAAPTALFDNCKAFNKRYPHGVGRKGARDGTKSGDPVTNFVRNTRLYRRAMAKNSDLDRDRDGVACEKR